MNKHVKKRNTKGLRSAQRIRGMSLLLIFCLLMNTVVPAPKCEASGDAGSGRQRVFEESGYRLEWSVSSSWETGYVSEVTVVNTGEEELRNWSVVATVSDGDIKNSWNVTHKKTDTGEWIFESETHNRIIKSGERTSFGFMAEGGAYSHLTSMKLVQGKILGIGDADIQWKETSSWDGHKIMEGTIINKSETSIKDWSLIFDMEGSITNIWNAVVISEDGGSFHVRNCDYNAVIEAGKSAVFGFEISYDTDSFRGIQNTEIL